MMLPRIAGPGQQDTGWSEFSAHFQPHRRQIQPVLQYIISGTQASRKIPA